jgi:hypothetical protein
VLRSIEAKWRRMETEPVEAIVLGEVVTLPRALLVAGRRELIVRVLARACGSDTGMVVELGSGWGQNLIDLYLGGGPRVPYYALEPTAEGRACTEFLAALAPELELSAFGFDFERPEYDLPRGNEHVLVFTCHSIEQITELPSAAITGLFGLGKRVTGVHFEPITWQLGDGSGTGAAREHARRKRYNKNLWPLLRELADAREIEIDSVVPDIVGLKPHNPATLVIWCRGRP